MDENMAFPPEPVRTRRIQEPVLILEDGSGHDDEPSVANNDNSENGDHFWPPSPKRSSLLADAILAYAADVGDAGDAPTTYQEGMQSNEPSEWMKTMNA
ncbi:polyprotein [Phytophthora megakarya]|uniref:Polyprotein n=1 Tax=Phytophthora megakarya TaxID=4795 RepID=A0A225WIK9_9STRA|nr:polyprotein [Phytophthora megakarya]